MRTKTVNGIVYVGVPSNAGCVGCAFVYDNDSGCSHPGDPGCWSPTGVIWVKKKEAEGPNEVDRLLATIEDLEHQLDEAKSSEATALDALDEVRNDRELVFAANAKLIAAAAVNADLIKRITAERDDAQGALARFQAQVERERERIANERDNAIDALDHTLEAVTAGRDKMRCALAGAIKARDNLREAKEAEIKDLVQTLDTIRNLVRRADTIRNLI